MWHVETSWKRMSVNEKELVAEALKRDGVVCGGGLNLVTNERDLCCTFKTKRVADAFARWLKKQHLRVTVVE